MRIGIDARMYGKSQSGIGNYIKQITDQIFKLDKTNEYFIFLLEPTFSSYQTPNNRVHKIKATAYWYGYAEQTKFLFQLLKYKLDLVHFPNFNAPILYPGKRITSIHDITPIFFPGHKQKSWWRKTAYQITLQASLAKSTKILVPSNSTKDDLIKHFHLNPAKIEVIYLGFEAQFKKIENYAKIKELKAKYGLHKPYLFYVSAWRNHKNFIGLIKAFELIRDKYNFDCQLVLGGQEDLYYPDISRAIASSKYKNDIIVPGFISDEELVIFYNAAQVFVIPSFYEGFGLTGLEAMACGIPVASANVTSLPEIMGQAAFYFDPHDTDAMAKMILRILTEPITRNELIAKGYAQIKKYSWHQAALQTWHNYQSILNQKI